MLKQLEQFICDRCGEVIKEPKEGWVEWLTDRDSFNKSGFKIVHHSSYSPRGRGGCYHYAKDPRRSDMHLDDFLGRTANTMLLSFLDVGPYHEEDYRGPRIEDMREFVEFARRLTLPFYEEARLYWSQAQEDGMFDGANEIWIYLPNTSEKIVRTYSDKKRQSSK